MIIFMGYSQDDLVKIILEYEERKQSKQRNIKMTRKEAINKLLNLGCQNSMLICELEALGLLKFEEEEMTPIMYTSIPKIIYDRYRLAIEEIEKAGYKIIKA